MRDINRIKGCLVGGAVGDALGYAVEFSRLKSILKEYGPNGITRYDLDGGLARISDDTQMALFTATALLFGETRGRMRGIGAGPVGYFDRAYLDWYLTQVKSYPLKAGGGYSSWLVNCKELFSRRAPGGTCLSALQEGGHGTVENPINNSKGCGGVRRVAPIGVYFAGKRDWEVEEVDMAGAEATLAISVYCALRHADDFEKAIIASVNHDGDSDSTGAVTGNILGTALGYDAIPDYYLGKLELREIIEEIADDLYRDCRISEYDADRDPVWISKYVEIDYRPVKQ